MPQRPSLAELDVRYSAPAPRRPSLEELDSQYGAPAPQKDRGFIDRVLTSSPRDWLSGAVRLGGGWLAGIPAAVPGLGTLAGGAIGGGSELLAQLISGDATDEDGIDWSGVGVGAAAGAIPMGKLISTVGKAATPLARAMALGKATGANVAKGAGLNVGLDVAYRAGHGEMPGDYSARDLIFPAVVGGGGMGLAGALGGRAAQRMGGAADQAPVTDAGSRRSAYRQSRGYDVATPPPAPEPQPMRSSTGPQPGLPVQPGMPARPSLEELDMKFGAPRWPRPEAIARGRGAMDAGGGPPSELADFFGLSSTRTPIGEGFSDIGQMDLGNMPVRGSALPPEPPAPRKPWELKPAGPGGVSRVDTAQAVSPAAAPVEFPPSREIAELQRFLENPNAQPPVNLDELSDIFGLGARELPPDLDVAPPGTFEPPTVGRMTVQQLRRAVRDNEPSVDAISRILRSGDDLPKDWQAELGMMRDELDSMPYVRGEAIDTGGRIFEGAGGGKNWRDSTQMGGLAYESNPQHPNLLKHFAGAPVYHDIMQGASGTRSGAQGAIERILGGGRPTSLSDRAVTVAQQRLLGRGGVHDAFNPARQPVYDDVLGGEQARLPGDVGGVRDLEIPDAQFGLPPVSGDDFQLRGQGGAGQTGALDFSGPPPPAGGDVDPRIRELYDQLFEGWRRTERELVSEGNPLAGGDLFESPPEFAQRLMTDKPRSLMGKERALRKILDAERGIGGDDAGFLDSELAAPLGGAIAGAAIGPWMDDEHPLAGAGIGALTGFLGGKYGPRLLERGSRVPPAAAPRRPPGRYDLGDSGFLDTELAAPLGGAVTGAIAGPWIDEDNPLRGAAAGAVGGGLAGLLGKRMLNREPMAPPPARRAPGPSRFDLGDMGGPEGGFASPELLAPLGGAATGAVAAPLVLPEEDPYVASVGGAGLGALAGIGATNPKLLERIRYSSLLSGMAVPKSMLGNAGAMAAYGAENPGGFRRVGRELFKPETRKALGRGWEEGFKRENLDPNYAPSLAYPGRIMGSFDEAARDVLVRSGALPDEAAQMVLMGEPSSTIGKKLTDLVHSSPVARAFLPFARTSVNMLERGMERTPGLGSMRVVEDWQNPSGKLPLMNDAPGRSPREIARRRQALGALAMLAGGGMGAMSAEGGPLEDIGPGSALISAALGPFALPFALGNLGTQGYLNDDGGITGAATKIGSGIERELPLPRTYTYTPGAYMRQFVPYGGAGSFLSPIEPNDFDTRDSLFAPTISRIPLLNEALLPQRQRGGR